MSDVNAINALLAQINSPDRAQRDQAMNMLEQMPIAVGRHLLKSAKQQVREVQELRKKYYDAAGMLTPVEQAKQLSAFQHKAAIASATIQLLGKLHIEEAIPFLVENIQFINPEQSNKHWFYPYRFPCLGALILLGPPAAEAMRHKIEEASEPESAWGGEEILVRMLGPHGAAGYLQDRIDILKEQQKTPVAATPKKPSPAPVSLRIERLEAVRTHVEMNAKAWASLIAF